LGGFAENYPWKNQLENIAANISGVAVAFAENNV
jgi:hypothetical protein